jgi:hypothetical protein
MAQVLSDATLQGFADTLASGTGSGSAPPARLGSAQPAAGDPSGAAEGPAGVGGNQQGAKWRDWLASGLTRLQWQPCFHPSFTLLGAQPCLVVPQSTGEPARCLPVASCEPPAVVLPAQVLPGLRRALRAAPAPAARCIARLHDRAALAAAGDIVKVRTSLAQGLLLAPPGPPAQQPQALVSSDVLDYLMPPKQAAPEVLSQVCGGRGGEWEGGARRTTGSS